MTTTYYARVDYTYTTGDSTFTIPFSYLKESHVKVFINGVATTNFSFNTTSQIAISDTLVAGDIVSIRRATKLDGRMVNFTNTSILSKDNQNLSAQQSFNLVQEMYDENTKFESDITSTIAANKTELEATIAANKAELEEAQTDFETEINATIAIVEEAAGKINELEEDVNTATGAATTATEAATTAVKKAQEISDSAAQIATNTTNIATNTADIVTLNTGLASEIVDRTSADSAISAAFAAADVLLQNQINDLKFISKKVYCEYLNFLKAGSTNTKLKILANTGIQFKLGTNNYFYKTSEAVEFDALQALDSLVAPQVTFEAGKDYSVYLCPTNNSFEFKVSLNATYPTGYSATTAFKIGGFHSLCNAVTSTNTPTLATGSFWTAHPAIGFATGDIIPNSVWCLTHRPIADPSGMAYVDRINKWVDIYLQSGTYSSTTSVYGATTTDTRQPILHQFDLLCVFKKMPTDNDFMAFAEGSNNLTAIAGAADAVTTGGHLDTAGKRMCSGYFIEDCCGFLWQWLNEIGFNGQTNWVSYGTGASERGQSYGMPFILHAGGSWDSSSFCGSWSRYCDSGRAVVDAHCGCRGVSRCLLIGKMA